MDKSSEPLGRVWKNGVFRYINIYKLIYAYGHIILFNFSMQVRLVWLLTVNEKECHAWKVLMLPVLTSYGRTTAEKLKAGSPQERL